MSQRAFSVSVRAQNGVWRVEDGIWLRIPLTRFVRQTADMSVWRDGVLDERLRRTVGTPVPTSICVAPQKDHGTITSRCEPEITGSVRRTVGTPVPTSICVAPQKDHGTITSRCEPEIAGSVSAEPTDTHTPERLIPQITNRTANHKSDHKTQTRPKPAMRPSK